MNDSVEHIAALQGEIGSLQRRVAELEEQLHESVVERKKIEESLNRRDAILLVIGFAAERFLKTTDVQRNTQMLLEHLGTATGMSRVYIFENHTNEDGNLCMSQRYEWVAPSITPQLENPNLQNVAYHQAGFSRWAEELAHNTPIYGNVDTFPDAERTILEAQHIQSLVIVPIFVATTWWGFMGFDDCQHAREWSTIDIDTIKIAATIIGSSIYRKNAEQERSSLQQHIINAQHVAIRELSSPLLPLANNVIVLPLIGSIDSDRAQQIMETLLEGVMTHQADVVIIDITGVKTINDHVAQSLMRTTQAVKLLGAHVVLTGIQPPMAQALTYLDADLSGITTRNTLQAGITYALHMSSSDKTNLW